MTTNHDTTNPSTSRKLDKLAELQQLRRRVEHDIDQLVLELRSPDLDGFCEASWAEVGDALGVTRQAAHRMYTRGRA